MRIDEDAGLSAVVGCRRAEMDRERPQTRCRHTRGLVPAGPDDSHRTDDVLPQARRAVRDQRGKRLDQTSGNRSVGATGTRTSTATEEVTAPQRGTAPNVPGYSL